MSNFLSAMSEDRDLLHGHYILCLQITCRSYTVTSGLPEYGFMYIYSSE
jgi:hypothetical protein